MKQEKRPPRILYWKWDDSHIDSGSYRAGIDDLCERSCFDTVFICTHWCRDGLSTKKHMTLSLTPAGCCTRAAKS